MNETQYLYALSLVLNKGIEDSDRTGVGTLRYPGITMRYNLQEGFPILTTKKIMFYPMVIELLWFLQGRNDHKWLTDRECNIWNDWHCNDGTIGPGYGVQWRKWPQGPVHSIDQIRFVIDEIKTNPNSRRLLVNAWNVAFLDQMALHPCHFSFQFLVTDGKLNCIIYQRSGDMFLGIPFNMASYALLTHMIAMECELIPGEVIHNIGDAHIYVNHIDQVKMQLERPQHKQPELRLSDDLFHHNGLLYYIDSFLKEKTLEEIKELIWLEDYKHEAFIRAPVAVRVES